jgi:hypothetical protein
MLAIARVVHRFIHRLQRVKGIMSKHACGPGRPDRAGLRISLAYVQGYRVTPRQLLRL